MASPCCRGGRAPNAADATGMARVIDIESSTASSVVRRYLTEHPALEQRLTAADIPVVVFECDGFDDEPAVFFARVAQLLAGHAARYGRALYVASCHARPFVRAGMTTPSMAAGEGVFVGYFAVGEGGALFIRPNGGRGAQEAWFDEAIDEVIGRA